MRKMWRAFADAVTMFALGLTIIALMILPGAFLMTFDAVKEMIREDND